MSIEQKRILIAEDEGSLREMLVMIIREEGYRVDAAEDGNQAWALMNANHYDLLVTDLYMPQTNGIELIQKSQQAYPETKIILISGGGKELEAEHGQGHVKFVDQQVDIDMFLKKPCDLDDIITAVEKVLL